MSNPYSNIEHGLNGHAQMLQDLSLVLSTPQGQNLFKYLLKELEFGELPAPAVPQNLRDEYIGFLRAGQLIFEYVSQADNMRAGMILAQIQKEKFDVLKDSENSNGQR